MARSITKYGVTSEGAAFTSSPVLNQQNYSKFAVVGGVANGEAVLSNTEVALGYDETLKLSSKPVKNVYQNADIDVSLQAPTKRGRTLLVSLDEIWKETDSEDATYEVALPMHGHIVLRVPNNSTLSYDDVLAFAQRLVSFLYGENKTTSARLRDMLKGAILPDEA
jgi:hypothetical protein